MFNCNVKCLCLCVHCAQMMSTSSLFFLFSSPEVWIIGFWKFYIHFNVHRWNCKIVWLQVSLIQVENFGTAHILFVCFFFECVHWSYIILKRVRANKKKASDRRKYVTDSANEMLKAIILITWKTIKHDAKRIMNWNYRSINVCGPYFFFFPISYPVLCAFFCLICERFRIVCSLCTKTTTVENAKWSQNK